MLAVLLPVLKKLGPYIVAIGLCFSAGVYAGYHVENRAVEAAKLALLTQQRNDADAVAKANAVAVSELKQAGAKANTAQLQLAAGSAAAGSWETTLTTEIGMQAALPGNDARDAPVLSATLDEIAKGGP